MPASAWICPVVRSPGAPDGRRVPLRARMDGFGRARRRSPARHRRRQAQREGPRVCRPPWGRRPRADRGGDCLCRHGPARTLSRFRATGASRACRFRNLRGDPDGPGRLRQPRASVADRSDALEGHAGAGALAVTPLAGPAGRWRAAPAGPRRRHQRVAAGRRPGRDAGRTRHRFFRHARHAHHQRACRRGQRVRDDQAVHRRGHLRPRHAAQRRPRPGGHPHQRQPARPGHACPWRRRARRVSAARSSRSDRRWDCRTPSRAASSARCGRSARSSSCRPTRPSTQATAAGRCWIGRAVCWRSRRCA